MIEVRTVGDLLLLGAARHPERDCLVLPDERRSYGELGGGAVRTARSLLGLGVGPGDRVGILMSNSIELVEALVGATLLGAIAVPINVRNRARELAHVIVDAEMAVLVTQRAWLEVIAEARALVPEAAPPSTLIDAAEFVEAGRALADEDVERRRRGIALDQPAVMFYTSGTTANPKGCVLSHEAFVLPGIAAAERFGYHADDRLWDPLPMFHTAFTQPFVGMLAVGGAFLSMRHFDADEALRMIVDEAATTMFPAFPTITTALLNHPDYRADTFARVRTAFNVAPPDTLRAMQERMPHTIQVSGFGMTETGGSVVLNELDDSLDARCTNQGPPLGGAVVRIVDPATGATVEAGEPGEILVHARSRFTEYWRDPVKTAEAIDPDGWFHTGDLGSLDEDGRLSYRGRLKDMLKVGGENVAAIEIESFLATHPAVSLAAVVGRADDKYGEVPVAFVELVPGIDCTADELVAHCRAGLAGFKVPREVRFVTEWPMSATKIQKFQLRAQLWQG